MARWLILWSSLSAALAVGLGAFGAHALRDRLPQIHPPEQVARMEANWETAARYHLVHAIGALVATLVLHQVHSNECRNSLATPRGVAVDGNPKSNAPSWRFWLPVYCLLLGPVIFSGCLYAMVLGAPKILGWIVPIGGALMIAGWVSLAIVSFVTSPRSPSC